jgi:hypothetical protein
MMAAGMTRLGCLGLLVALSVHAADATAYCRTSTCGNRIKGAVCSPESTRQDLEPPADCGTPLYWGRPCIGFAVNERASNQIGADDIRAVLMGAFATWETASCGVGTPSIHVEDLGEVACGEVEYNPEGGGNVNVIVFHDDEWPHEGSFNTLALTTVSFEVTTGEIFDADMEVNSASKVLTISETTSDFDLLSVLTHEAGHALGLAHSDAVGPMGEQATMTPVVIAGNTEFRSLTLDDIAGVCAAYPPRAEPAKCNPIPRHGFSSECLAGQNNGDCAAAPGHRGARVPFLALGALVLVALSRRLGGRRA